MKTKTTCLLAFSAVLLVIQCTSQPPLTEQERSAAQKQVSDFFLQIRMAIKKRDVVFLYQNLTKDSKEWFEDIRRAADTEPLRFLENRPFYEILFILALRMEQRLKPGSKQDPITILRRTVLEVGPIRNNIIKHPLGKFRLDRDRAEVGLRKAPNTPVFFCSYENEAWRFDLVKSLPIILLGAENLARQKKQTTVEQAVFILEKVFGAEVMPDDLFD